MRLSKILVYISLSIAGNVWSSAVVANGSYCGPMKTLTEKELAIDDADHDLLEKLLPRQSVSDQPREHSAVHCDGGSLELYQSPRYQRAQANGIADLRVIVHFEADDPKDWHTLTIQQSIFPSKGLEISPYYRDRSVRVKEFFSEQKRWRYRATAPGEYRVVTRVHDSISGANVELSSFIVVRSSGPDPDWRLIWSSTFKAIKIPIWRRFRLQNVPVTIELDRTKPLTLEFEQEIDPPDALEVFPALDGKTIVLHPEAPLVYLGEQREVAQAGVAHTAGPIRVHTRVRIPELDHSFSSLTQIQAGPPLEPGISVYLDDRNQAGSRVSRLQLGKFVIHNFIVKIEEKDSAWLQYQPGFIRSVIVKEMNSGQTYSMKQKEKSERFSVFSGPPVRVTGLEPDTCFKFIAEAETFKGEIFSSSPVETCITRFPTVIYWVEKKEIRANGFPDGEGKYVSKDLFEIKFLGGIQEKRIVEIVESIGGDVIGTVGRRWVPGASMRVRFRKEPPDLATLRSILAELAQMPEVASVEELSATEGSGIPIDWGPEPPNMVNVIAYIALFILVLFLIW